MKISQLQPGDRFSIPSIERSGVLVATSPGRAIVKYDGERETVNISLSTEVTPTLDDLL